MNWTHERASWEFWDGKFRFRLGGLIQVDGTAIAGDEEFSLNYGDEGSSVQFRRARLSGIGALPGSLFSVQYDFGPDPGLKDAYVETLGRHLKGASFRVGKFKEPFSLEKLTSTAYVAFVERSLPVQAFVPGRSLGAQLFNPILDQRATWALGAFANTENSPADEGAGASDLTLTGRITGLPWYEKGGNRLLHVGVSLSARSPKGGTVRYGTRPEARSAPVVVDTGHFEASSSTLIGFEVAGTVDRTWFMAEFLESQVRTDTSGDPRFRGYYAQIGHFLTRDKKPYDQSTGVFGHALPSDPLARGAFHALDSLVPFRHGRSHGAWEIVGRFSHVDLNDGSIQGGKATDLSAAVNWYVNTYIRFELNYVHTEIESGGSANIIVGRLQLGF